MRSSPKFLPTLMRLLMTGGMLCVGHLLAGVPAARAAEEADEVAVVLPSEFAADPAFDRYVDLQAFSAAIVAGDAVAAADGTLQLAAGERVLFREHVSISADQAFDLTLQAAIGHRDAQTIARLEKATEPLGRTAWTPRLAAAKVLLSASRTAEPTIDVAQWSPEAIELARSVQTAAQFAKLTGDKALLDAVVADVQASTVLSDAQKAQFVEWIAYVRKNLPEEPNPAAAAILPKIIGSTRGTTTPPCPPGALAIMVDGGTAQPSTSGASIVVNNGLKEPVYLPGQVAIAKNGNFGVRGKAGTVTIGAWRFVRRKVTVGKSSFFYYDAFPVKSVKVSSGFSLTGGSARVSL